MKQSTRDSRVYLDDILNSIKKIEEYSKNISSEKDLINNNLVSDAIIRNLEIIGEAVKNLPSNFKKKNSQIEWKKIAGLRDILIHEYFGIDEKILLDIIKNKIPELKEQVKKLIETL